MLRTLLWVVLALVGLLPSVALAQPAARRTADGGSIITTTQTHRGIVVVGAGTVVRRDAAGLVQWQWSSERHVPSSLSITPTISRESAIARVSSQQIADASLVIWAPAAIAPRLAWRITLPVDLVHMRAMRLYVDARNGGVLSSANRVEHDREARVYEENPVTTPDLATVTLESLPVGATQLDDAEIVGRSCVDRGQCATIPGTGGLGVHVCDLEATAIADASGDFLFTPPTDTAATDDTFAEVQAYRHAARAMTFFHSLGLAFGRPTPLVIAANVRFGAFDPSDCVGGTSTSPLTPVENGVFVPAGALGGFPPSDSLLLGQGATIDFAYDGDVVVHEMTHAVAATLASFADRNPDSAGLDTSPAAMNEGFADYFAAVVNGNAAIAEHAGGAGPLRSIDGTSTCPLSVSGNAHADSVIWSGALWQARNALDALDRAAFDRVVFEVLGTVTETDSWLTVARRLGNAADATIGSAQGETVRTVMEERGLVDCSERIIDTATLPVQPRLELIGNDLASEEVLPGPVQYRLVVDAPASEIRVSMASFESVTPSTTPAVTVLLKADEAIVWSWDAAAPTHDATTTAAITPSDAGAMGVLTGDFPAGTYYLTFSNSDGSVRATDVAFTAIDAPTDAGTSDAGLDASTPGIDAGTPVAAPSNGCSCGVGVTQSSPSLAMLLLASLAAFVRARRR